MYNFLLTYWAEILLSLVTAGSLAFCRYLFKEMKHYKELLQQQEHKEITILIDEQLIPIKDRINNLEADYSTFKKDHAQQLSLIINSYKFRFRQLCKGYLDRGFITTKQFDQLSEFYEIYEGLGGEVDLIDDYYEKAKKLPIKDKEDKMCM